MGIYSGSGSPYVTCSTVPRLARFFYIDLNRTLKHVARFVLAQCHHGFCSENFNRSFPDIKLDRHVVPTGSFFVFQISDDVRNAYTKKTADKIPAEGNCQLFWQRELV